MISINSHLTMDEAQQIANSKKDIFYFEPLYKAHYKSVYKFVGNRIASNDDVKDLVSQVFLKAMSKIGKYQAIGQGFSAWLFRIAFNEIADFYRHKNKRIFINIEENGIEKLQEESGLELDSTEGQAMLANVLLQLNKDEIQLIQLRYFDALSYFEMATILNCTESNARVKTFRTIKKLQNIYPNETK
ncbi:MAG: sigma-70 family RNA polymerase sigma factor [bacterium]|nr:sigma-70 family RNA polymerase sigma factor [bacterium]